MLDKFFNPKSVAIIGASHDEDKPGRVIFENFVNGKYDGKVYAVNKDTTPIMGNDVYQNVGDIEDKVDMAVVVTPSSTVPDILEECAKSEINNIVIVSSGFSEIGVNGKELEECCKKIISENDLNVIGPNCLGVYDSSSGVDTMFLSQDRLVRPGEGDIAFISQSGAVGSSVLDWLSEHGIGISKFVSYGNAVDINESDLFEYLLEDDDTRVIVSYLEGINCDGKDFVNIVKGVTSKKPIIMLKAGKTDKGSEAVASHTGSLAGSSRVYSAAFKQSGVLEAQNWTELFDYAKALSYQPLPKGDNLLIITDGGGFGVLATDEADRLGLKLPEPSDAMKDSLRDKMPNYVSLKNPMDLTGDATSGRYQLAIEHGLKEFDGIVLILIFQIPTLERDVVSKVIDISKKSKKPIICCSAGGNFSNELIDELERNGIPTYSTPEMAVKAFDIMRRYSDIMGE